MVLPNMKWACFFLKTTFKLDDRIVLLAIIWNSVKCTVSNGKRDNFNLKVSSNSKIFINLHGWFKKTSGFHVILTIHNDHRLISMLCFVFFILRNWILFDPIRSREYFDCEVLIYNLNLIQFFLTWYCFRHTYAVFGGGARSIILDWTRALPLFH